MKRIPIHVALLAAGAVTCLQAWAQPTPRDARRHEIVAIAARAEMPFTEQDAIPFLVTWRARTQIGQEGRSRGFGNVWNPNVPEWRDLEKRIEEEVKDAIANPPRDTAALNTCLQGMADADLAKLHEMMRSDAWPRHRHALDRYAALTMLAEVNREPRLWREAVVKKIKDAGPDPSNTLLEMHTGIRGTGVEKCLNVLELSVIKPRELQLERANEIIQQAQQLMIEAMMRFKARYGEK